MAYVPSIPGPTTIVEVDNFADLVTALASSTYWVVVKPGTYVATEDMVIPSNKRISFQGEVIINLGTAYKIRTDLDGSTVYGARTSAWVWSEPDGRFQRSNPGPVELWDGYITAGTQLWYYDRAYEIVSHGNDGSYDYIVPAVFPKAPFPFVPVPASGIAYYLVTNPVTDIIMDGILTLTEDAARADTELVNFYGMRNCNLSNLTILRNAASTTLQLLVQYSNCMNVRSAFTQFESSLMNGAITGNYRTTATVGYGGYIMSDFDHSSMGYEYSGTGDGYAMDDREVTFGGYMCIGTMKQGGASCVNIPRALTRQLIRIIYSTDIVITGPLYAPLYSDQTQYGCQRIKYLFS